MQLFSFIFVLRLNFSNTVQNFSHNEVPKRTISYLKAEKFPKFFSRKLTLEMLRIQIKIVEAIAKIFLIILALDYNRFENGI